MSNRKSINVSLTGSQDLQQRDVVCVVYSVTWQRGKNNCHTHAAYWSDRLPQPYLNITYKQRQRVTQPSPQSSLNQWPRSLGFFFLLSRTLRRPSRTEKKRKKKANCRCPPPPPVFKCVIVQTVENMYKRNQSCFTCQACQSFGKS